MKTREYTKPGHNLSQLHDELLAAIPALRPVTEPGEALGRPVMNVRGSGDTVLLDVPDDADEQAIAAVVQAHVPQPRAEDIERQALTLLKDKLDADTSLTAAELRRVLRYVLKRML